MTDIKHFLVASDFDQTLSFNDSGQILSDLLGVRDFQRKVDGLASSNLVHQGGELAYLIRHDPAFRGVRPEHLAAAGRRVRLRGGIQALVDVLARGLAGMHVSYLVVSAAPKVIHPSAAMRRPITSSAPSSVHTESAVQAIRRASRATARSLRWKPSRGSGHRRIAPFGGDAAHVHVMLHVNNRDGFTIAVSEIRCWRIARSTVITTAPAS